MRLYRLIVHGRARYVGTQADARALKRDTGSAWNEVDVPTGKAELIAFLNGNASGASAEPAPTLPPAVPPPVEQPSTTPPRLAFDATSVLTRMDIRR